MNLKLYLFYCLITITIISQISLGAFAATGADKELPQIVDFEEFNGTNLSDIHPDWQEATGVLQPEFAGGGWYAADILFESKTATITFDYLGLNDDWIISSQFMAGENTKVSFEAALTRFWDDPAQGNLNFNDSVSILVSTNTETFDFAHHVFSFKQENQPDNQLERFEFDLGQFAGQMIHLAFYATNGQEANSLGAFHLDNIVIKDAADIDVMPLSLVSPEPQTCFSGPTPVMVQVYNDGIQPVSSVPVKVAIRGAAITNINGVYPGTLQPGESGVFQAGMADLSAFGDYHITVSTQQSDDGYLYNNQLPVVVVSNPEPLDLPLPFMNFIGFYSSNLSEVYPGWYEARGKDHPQIAKDTDWQGESYDGARTANVYFSQLGTEDWLVGPKLSATENMVVEFRAAIEASEGESVMGSDDKLKVMISEDCGATWQEAAAIDASFNIGESLQPYSFDLSEYAGKNIHIAFYATTGSINDPEQYLFHITDIDIKNQYQTDAGVVEILSPGNACSFTNSEELTVKIQNFGTEPVSNFDVAYQLNEESIVTETISQTIAAGEAITYTFTALLDLTQQTENTIDVFINLNNDQNSSNDGILGFPFILSSFDLSTEGEYSMGFETDEDYSDWLIEDGNNDGTEWELNEDSQYANSGNNSFQYFSNQTSVTSDDYLFSPCFNLVAGETYYVSFYYRNRATSFPEKLKLDLGQMQNSGAMNVTLIDLGEISNGSFMKAELEFSVETTGQYYFGLHAYGEADQFGLYVDDFTLYQIFDTDIAVLDMRAPRTTDDNCMLDNVQSFDVKVWNPGTVQITDPSFSLQINEMAPLDITTTANLDPGAEMWLNLSDPNIGLDPYTAYDVSVTANVPGDQNAANDTYMENGFVHANYFTSFEEDQDADSWVTVSNSGVNEWQQVNDGDHANTGLSSFAIRTDFANGNDSNDDWLISDCHYLEPGKCYILSFYYKSRFSTENLTVYMGDAQQPVSLSTEVVDLPSINSNSYLYQEVQFTVDQEGAYYFGWHTDGGTSGRYFIYVDDISIREDAGGQPVADPVFEILDTEVFFQANAENYASLEWDFGDGNTSDQPETFHDYLNAGTYNATLMLTSGCVDASFDLDINIECNTTADFSFSDNLNTVDFTATGDAIEYEWNFGDGNMGWGSEVNHLYDITETTTFTVEMTAFFDCGENTVAKEITVNPPQAYSVSVSVDHPDHVTIAGEGDFIPGEEVALIATIDDQVAAFIGWYEDDALLSDQTTYIFTMPERDVNLEVVTELVTGVHNLSSADISLFPNPAQDMVKLQSPVLFKMIEITDLSGKVIEKHQMITGQSEIALDIADLDQGLYLIRIIMEDDSILMKKMQINR